jgi:hypothetical protein
MLGTAQVGSFLSDGFLELGPIEMAQTLSLDSAQRRLSTATKKSLELV